MVHPPIAKAVKPASKETMSKTIPMKPVDRNSVDGRFVTPKYAEKHPRTTEHERVPVSNPKK
jgi:hypothetical protein